MSDEGRVLTGRAAPSVVHTIELTTQVLEIVEGHEAGGPIGPPVCPPKSRETWAAERARWMHQVEETTRASRLRLALRHEQQAERVAERLAELQLQLGELTETLTPAEVPAALEDRRRRIGKLKTRQHWHQVRAQAHRERFERVAACSVHIIKRSCADCDAVKCQPIAKCRSTLLCYECRSAAQAKYRVLAREGMRRAEERARLEGRAFKGACPRFITLTTIHSGTPAEDAATLQRAWPKFTRRLSEYLRQERGWSKRQVRQLFIRRMEATESTGGHMHLHAWMVLPFIPRAILAHLWGRALHDAGAVAVERVPLLEALEHAPNDLARSQILEVAVTRRGKHGRPLVTLYAPHVRVRRADADEAADELAKYLCKDIEDGELIDPETFARLFMAFAGRRSISATRTLLTVAPVEDVTNWCEECGGFHFVTRLVRTDHDARGPPDAAAPPQPPPAVKTPRTPMGPAAPLSSPHVAG